jgi:lactoylglutathione lyase
VNNKPEVTELRLVVTAPDYEQALQFYRDVLGLPDRAAYASPGGRVTILEADGNPSTRASKVPPACS